MTGLAAISRADALSGVAQSLGLPTSAATVDGSNNALIAQSIRRSVFIAAPCSARIARTLVTTALGPLADDLKEMESRIGDVIDDLVAIGDLLEMRRESADGEELVLRPAPPAFIKRKDQTFILLGVSGDEITPVNDHPVAYRPSGLRTLAPSDPEVCHSALLDLGLIELSDSIWLHAPAAVAADRYLNGWITRLPPAGRPEEIEGLEILDTKTPTTFYKGRWKPLSSNHSGYFLARRPQRYGANLWCVAEVQDGLVQRFIDIHSRDGRIRDCDEAWRVQAAFDSVAGAPQKVAVSSSGARATLSFSSPLPAWTVRRLSLIGERVTPRRALLAFELPSQNMDDEIRWLEDTLWIARDAGGDS
jgi:hypothetical protein